jgi:predicted transcriptional regulator
MKAILMSIRPQYLINILNGNKTRELRKSVPTNFVGWVYLNCTKGKPYLAFESVDYDDSFGHSATDCGYSIQNNIDDFDKLESEILNGKIVARFWFDEYETVSLQLVDKSGYDEDRLYDYETQKLSIDELLLKTCLEYEELHNYLDNKEYGYAWHIKNLEIFYKPMELSEFAVFDGWEYYELLKAPQSWQYVYIKEKE